MGGNVGGSKYNIAQQSPFGGKIGAELDSIQSSVYNGKLTPMYEKQPKRGMFHNPNQTGGKGNVFASLNPGHSVDGTPSPHM
jgi:hypothetical protein